MNTNKQFYTYAFLFAVPLFLLIIISNKLSPNYCFLPNATNPKDVEDAISKELQSQYESIQSLNPILQLGNDWFRYDVSLRNALKVAFTVSKPTDYWEATTTLLIETESGTSTLKYGEHHLIATGIRAENIPGLLKGFNFYAQSNHRTIVGPNEIVSAQTNPALGGVCISTSLQEKNLYLIYVECLLFVIGLGVVLRELFSMIRKGLFDYLTKD